MAVHKITRTARLGIGAFVIDTTRRAAKKGRIKPRLVSEKLSREEKRLPADQQAFLVEQRQLTNERALALYTEVEGFDKAVQLQMADRDGAFADPRLENIVDEQFRPKDNDAFIRNALLNASSFESEQEFLKSELFNDQDRNIGLFPKEPTQATITIQAFVTTKGQVPTPLVVTNEFVLSSVSEASQEKYQIFQTFDDDFIYFFDRNPHIYTYGGLLVNAAEIGSEPVFEWKNRFQSLYEKILRGTKCVENNARAILTYENVVREGFLLNFSMSEDARNPLSIPFSFTFFVTRETNNHRSAAALPVDFVGVRGQLGGTGTGTAGTLGSGS